MSTLEAQRSAAQTPTSPSTAQQAAVLLPHIAGYVGHRTIATGLRTGLLAALADEPDGLTPDGLADRCGTDRSYTAVWCRAAFAAGVCARLETDGGVRYRLEPHMATLLLDAASPAYLGGTFTVFEQHEMFGRFEAELRSGERLWWDRCSPGFITAVSATGTPFYTRLVPGGLGQVPGLADRLAAGGRILDTACGTGVGLVRLAQAYPSCQVVGVDGDAHSVQVARERLAAAGLTDRVEVHVSPLEDLDVPGGFALVTNNISMHECRDADRVAAAVMRALEPGGRFVISDFPFPDTAEGLRSVPGRIMGGIQFFEAQIDDQLLPRVAYDALLGRHGFTDLWSTTLTPVHALTCGRRPGA